MSARQVLIFGGKGTAINIAEQIQDAQITHACPLSVLGFAIDDPSLGQSIAGFPVVCGSRDAWSKYATAEVDFVFALYRPDAMAERVALLRSLQIPPGRFANFVHPLAYVAKTVTMGFGNVVLAHASIQHGVRLGSFNIVNSHVCIEHDTVIADGSFLSASATLGAHLQLGTGVFVGLNATVRENLSIGDYAFVGLGSAVVKSVDANTTVYGVPARRKT